MLAFIALSLAALAAPAAPCSDRGDYTVCEAAAGADIRLFLNDKDGAPLKDFDAVEAALARRGERLLFAMNAGMYHKDRSPVGLYVEEGLEKKRLVTTDGPGNFHLKPNGVFIIREEGAAVLRSDEFAGDKKIAARYATQSGPMLVIDGAIHPKFLADSDSRKYRNGVGVREDGSAVFAISDRPVTFHEFALFMRDEMKTPNALYLDGTISRLFATSLARNDPGAPMGPIVGVVEKAATASATYIANEGVMVAAGEVKFLFDPLMQDDRGGVYRLPPPEMLAKLKSGAAPFDGVDAIFISHAHADHFSAEAVNAYLAAHGETLLYAPEQAVAMMRAAPNWKAASASRIAAVALRFGDAPAEFSFDGASVSGVRIPHAGGARTADVENIAWRVEADLGASVMHLGDGEGGASDVARAPALAARRTGVVFAPFWVAGTKESAAALAARLNASRVIGVHVPVIVPDNLKASGADYFSTPGETRAIVAPKEKP